MRHLVLSLASFVLVALLSSTCFAASSAEIRNQISQKIDEVSLGGHEIDIEVRRGVVTLNGFVGSDAARRQVEEIATNTEGVESVESRLTVRPSGNAAQQQLAKSVWNNIQSHKDLGTYKIQILGKGDKVVLSGTAASERVKTALEEIARSTAGVTAVENTIVVGS
ncbi:MAG: BON domain-containing protein [Deltaproteobacteria bacterium]|nr:BON domain-containing protein [Deltaproteobacteria bacterium]